MSKQIETAASRLRKLRNPREDQLHTVVCSCGMDWKCNKISIKFWVTSGILPSNLASKMSNLATQPGASSESFLKAMSGPELAQSIEFSSKVVRLTAVEPRIVDVIENVDIDITPDEVMVCCYETLRDWQITGGVEGANLETFRVGQREHALDGADLSGIGSTGQSVSGH